MFTLTGGTGASFATPTVTTNTAATDVLTTGSANGVLTFTDHSTGAQTTFLVGPLLSIRADNVDGSGGLGANSPLTTTWADLSGGGHDGTLTSWPGTGTPMNGWRNVGTITMPDQLIADNSTPSSGLRVDFGSLGAFPPQGSLEIWYTAYIWDGGTNHRNVATTNYNGGNNAIRFEQATGPDTLQCIISDVAGSTVNINAFGTDSARLFTDNQILVTWDVTANRITGYLNGVQVFNDTSSANWPSSLVDFALFTGFNTSRGWWGSVRIARVYSNSLTSGEVMTHFLADSSTSSMGSVGITQR